MARPAWTGGVIWLEADDGSTWNYAGLKAWDARGRELPAELGLRGGDIRLWVETIGATWLITVDPVLTSASTTLTGTASSSFGYSMASADVNGDGYDDAIIGAYTLNSTNGGFYVYHGSSTGLASAASLTVTSATYDGLGYDVEGVGDLNGDGYEDVAVVGPYYNSSSGKAIVYYGSATGLSTANTTTITPSDVVSVGRLGDVNGDGYDDLGLGGTSGSGGALVYHGSSRGVPTAYNGYTIGRAWEDYAALVLGADVNGDGYSDMIVGAPDTSYTSFGSNGRVYIYRGSANGIGSNAIPTTTLSGNTGFVGLGAALQSLGDVNGDGYDDVLVGANPTSYYGNYLTINLGSSAGLSSNSAGLYSGTVGDYYGQGLAAGDFDGDGDPDLAIGARGQNGGRGNVYTFSSSSAGMSTAADTTLTVSSTTTGLGRTLAAGDFNGDGSDDLLVADNNVTVAVYAGYGDADGDGYNSAGSGSLDCDDSDPSVHPGAADTDADGIDSNCDGSERCYGDADGDGYRTSTLSSSADGDCSDAGEALASAPSGDCNDGNTTIYPGAVEDADNVDTDCDGTELCFGDADGDGYRDNTLSSSADADCSDAGEALATVPSGDCDDNNSAISPGATEVVADGIDADCDGQESCYADVDGDGYRTDTAAASADTDCSDLGEANASLSGGDCNDNSSGINPGMIDSPADGVDANCDGIEQCYSDVDADGYHDDILVAGDTDCSDPGEATAAIQGGDCDDAEGTINPGATKLTGDGIDADCDGDEHCYADTDNDGYRSDEVIVSSDTDCTDSGEALSSVPDGDCDNSQADAYPGGTELPADGIDGDCDGTELCFVDADADGYRTEQTTTSSDGDCEDEGEAVTLTPADDCNDDDKASNPGATEICDNNVDEDCDGKLDNGCSGGTDDSGSGTDDSGKDTGPKDDRDKGLFGCSSTSSPPASAALLLSGLLLARRRRQS